MDMALLKVAYPGCCRISNFIYELSGLGQGARFEQILKMICTCLECSLGRQSRELMSVLCVGIEEQCVTNDNCHRP